MKIEIEPGSPEEKILNAIVESMEASGKIVTVEDKEQITCSFMMGYTAGSSIAGTKAAIEFRPDKKMSVEETIKALIQSANDVVFKCLLK